MQLFVRVEICICMWCKFIHDSPCACIISLISRMIRQIAVDHEPSQIITIDIYIFYMSLSNQCDTEGERSCVRVDYDIRYTHCDTPILFQQVYTDTRENLKLLYTHAPTLGIWQLHVTQRYILKTDIIWGEHAAPTRNALSSMIYLFD